MLQPRSTYLLIDGHEIHVTDWGDPQAPAVVMWHGLARTGRDFDTIARQFAASRRVICPDTIGRGLSSWSRDPDRDYVVPTYVTHARTLLDQLRIEQCDWIGTSMGGLIGLLGAAGPLAGRIRRMVMNDVGPEVPAEALAAIKAYLTTTLARATMGEFETLMRALYQSFGPLTDAEWRLLAETSARRREDGWFTTHYDPEIMRVFAERIDQAVSLWPLWDMIDLPVLVLRGESSRLLTPEIAQTMTESGPKARLRTIPGCGHAPALNTPEQIALISSFLFL